MNNQGYKEAAEAEALPGEEASRVILKMSLQVKL
jgi:hypothetical protein